MKNAFCRSGYIICASGILSRSSCRALEWRTEISTQHTIDLFPRQQGDAIILSPEGRVDHSNAAALQSAIEPYLQACKPGGHRLVLDLSRLDYISSAGLRILMIAAKQVKSQQGIIAVAAMRPVVREIFEISKFTFVLKCFESVDEALAYRPDHS